MLAISRNVCLVLSWFYFISFDPVGRLDSEAIFSEKSPVQNITNNLRVPSSVDARVCINQLFIHRIDSMYLISRVRRCKRKLEMLEYSHGEK